jgi:DNA polymerase III subunit gamma/tau
MPRKKKTPTDPPGNDPTPIGPETTVTIDCTKCLGSGTVAGENEGGLTGVPCDQCEGTGQVPAFVNYRLPDGTIVPIMYDSARNAPTITYTLEGGEVVEATRVDEPTEPVNPVQAAADLAAAEPQPEPVAAPPSTPPAPDHIPDFLMKLREEVIRAELEYDDAAEEAKRTKKSWEEIRERFERAFDAEIRKGKEPGLPFDGVHMSDTAQPEPPAPPAEPADPADVLQFPRAVPDAEPAEPTAADIANDPADPTATPDAPPPPSDEPDPTVH